MLLSSVPKWQDMMAYLRAFCIEKDLGRHFLATGYSKRGLIYDDIGFSSECLANTLFNC